MYIFFRHSSTLGVVELLDRHPAK